MKKIALFLFSILILVSEASFSGPDMITSVEKIRVRPAVAYVKLSGCKGYNRIYLDTEYGKAMFSVALVAATANKQVYVEFVEEDGCETKESKFVLFEVIYQLADT